MASPGLKRDIFATFIASFDEVLCLCCRDKVVGYSSCVFHAALSSSQQKRIFASIHPSLIPP